MIVEQQVIKIGAQTEIEKPVKTKPLTSTWKKAPFILNHSIRAAVNEMLTASETYDVVKIGIIGDQSTGKTTLMQTLQHLFHKLSDERKGPKFAVRTFGKDQFVDMNKTLSNLAPANYILGFDDISFLGGSTNKRQIEQIKQTITVIRHLKQDVKIILIYNYHYTLGLDKYLRGADYRFFTSISSSEDDNVLNIVGMRNQPLLTQFKKISNQIKSTKKASFKLADKKPWFSYEHRKPFAPQLFWNETSLRIVVSPSRHWIDPICDTCTVSDNLNAEVPFEDFKKEFEYKFTEPAAKAAVRLKLFANGMVTYSPNIVNAMKFLDQALARKIIPLEAIAKSYELTITKARLRKTLEWMNEKPKEDPDATAKEKFENLVKETPIEQPIENTENQFIS